MYYVLMIYLLSSRAFTRYYCSYIAWIVCPCLLYLKGDYGKLGHGNHITQKSPKLILGPLQGKVQVVLPINLYD